MKRFAKSISFYIVLFILIAFIYSFLNTGSGAEVNFSTFVNLLNEGKISEIEIEDLRISAKVSEKIKLDDSGREYDSLIVPIQSVGVLYAQAGDIIREQTLNKTLKVNMTPQQPMPFWLSMLPTLVLVVIFIVFWYFLIHQSQGGGGGGRVMSFGKSRARLVPEENKKTTFDDVAGADEEKEELREIVEFLRAPRRFIELGARIPKGVLLVGPPGTGKTLLAKAVSGEANVPFFSISGSDFVEMFVGVGASRVRDLFEQAKKNSPCIIFIDEIDAVGRHRGAGLGGGHDEREQTLNQLLVEMNGFGTNEGIIIIAATNRPDILDPALLRPGRFDRQVVVGVPDVKGREEILRIHSRGKPLAEDVDLSVIAKTTAGFTGADLENLMNESALLSARREKKELTMSEIEESMVKVIAGPEKKTKVITEKEKRITAFHEAGHAVISKLLPEQDPVHQVSIIPRGRAGGYTLSLPSEDKMYATKSGMLDDIVVLLGGRVAEKLVFDDISTGASNDIKRATQMAHNMVTKYGMSEQLGPMTFGTDHDEIFIGRDLSQTKSYSEHVAAEIDFEIRKIISSSYNKCKKLLEENMHRLKAVAQALLEREKLDAAEFEALFNGAQA